MLTDVKVRGLKRKATLYRESDADGLAVEVPVSGALRWRYRYRFAGKAKMLSLGTYPSVSLAQARLRRDAARAQLAHGIDPSTHRQTVKHAQIQAQAPVVTFRHVAQRWTERQSVAQVTANKSQ